MEGDKLEISSKEAKDSNSPAATYRAIPEDDMEEQVPAARPKSLVKEDARSNEPDGADERMLPDNEKKVNTNSNINLAEVKFINNEKQNGDAKLDIGDIKPEFVGLTKEELMKFANDPFWVRLRWFLFILFWALWAGMLIGAVMIIVAAPKCAPPEPKTWWEEGPLTEVQIPITENELAELKHNGVMGIIVPYPEDTYKALDPVDSFMSLLNLAKKHDIRVIVDLDPTVSDNWFNQSEAKDDNFNEFYIWKGVEGASENYPPNNWLSPLSKDDNKKSAWQYSQIRKQFYLAPFSQPQLNFNSAKVIEKFSNVLTSFLDAGVGGVRLLNAPRLLVDGSFANESFTNIPSNFSQDNYNFYYHKKTENLLELGALLKPWRDIIKNKTDNGVFMLADELTTLDPYTVNNTLIVDLPKQSHIFAESPLNATKLKEKLDSFYKNLNGRWPAWEITNNDYQSDVLKAVAYLLRGSLIIEKDFDMKQELRDPRKSPSVMFGSDNRFVVANKTVFAYVRVHSGNPGFLVAFNPTDERVVVDFPKEIPMVSGEVTVQYLSNNYAETGIELRIKSDSRTFPMSPKSAVILSYVPKDQE